MTEWTNPPPPEPVDTYRTPGTQPEPPEPSVCYDCKHARHVLEDGHAEMNISRDDLIRQTHMLRCADGEKRSADVKCFTSGNVRKGVAIEREWCNAKNGNGLCASFVRHVRPKEPTRRELLGHIGTVPLPVPRIGAATIDIEAEIEPRTVPLPQPAATIAFAFVAFLLGGFSFGLFN